jgi:hypothetical protein
MRNLRSRGFALPAAIIVVLLAAAAVAAGSGILGRGVSSPPVASRLPSTQPSSGPVAPPASPADPSPSAPAAPAGPTPTPAGPANDDDASDGVDTVDLVNLPGVDSTVVVWDETDSLLDAVSGSPLPVAGLPVQADGIRVEATDSPDTIRVRWAELPLDGRARLAIRVADGAYRLTLFRNVPASANDGVVSERILLLRFHVAVPVADVTAKVQLGLVPSASLDFESFGLASSDGTGITIAVWDETEGLAAARIASMDRKATLAARQVRVVNVDPDTLRVAWADPRMAGSARISIRTTPDGTSVLRIVRDRLVGPSRPVALDRVVDLDFLGAIDAESVRVELIDHLAAGA